MAASQWFNSAWHAEQPVSIDYPIWTNNSCNPIWPNGTSITGDPSAGARGCSIGAYPAYVVNATSAQQIGAALTWAAQKNVRVVIKNTGHSYSGRSIGYGSLSIWTHHMRGINYDEKFKPAACPNDVAIAAARVAAGHSGIEVQIELAKHGVFAVTGSNPSVGLVGWLTGGGHGPMSTTYGMGADNLLQATIITPDGQAHVTSPCQNRDLFFAIRGGGGGTYGVVTELVVRTFPTPKTANHIFRLLSISPTISKEYYEFLAFLHKELPRLKKGGMQGYYYVGGPPIVPSLSFQWTFWLYDKPEGTVEQLMKPIFSYLDERKHLFFYSSNITYADTYLGIYQGNYANEAVANGGSAYGSRLLSERSLADTNLTAKIFAQIGPSNNASKPNVSFATTNPFQPKRLSRPGTRHKSHTDRPLHRLPLTTCILPRHYLHESILAKHPHAFHKRILLARQHSPTTHHLHLLGHHVQQDRRAAHLVS